MNSRISQGIGDRQAPITREVIREPSRDEWGDLWRGYRRSRAWEVSVRFPHGNSADFFLPITSHRSRTERVILYSLAAYESFRDIMLTVQQILCQTCNDWIIWCQSCVTEGPAFEDLPEDFRDSI